MAPIKNIKGQKFNHLTAIEHKGHGYWLFRCDCGNEVIRYQSNITNGSTKSCGCWRKFAFVEDLTGRRFGRLTVIGRAPNKGERTMWICKCDCGNIKTIGRANLVKGTTQSCGCLHKEAVRAINKKKHGGTGSPTYIRWRSMKSRCYNPNDIGYANYGGRGIRVCERWLNSYEAFVADMGVVPSREYTLDRIDVNGDYCPENCKWATMKEQSNNKRNNRLLTHNNRTQTISQWCDELGFSRNLAQKRLLDGFTEFEDIFAPNKSNKAVHQLSEDGTIIRTFPSVVEAARVLGINRYSIYDRCNHKILNPGKYRFEYAI